MNHFDNPDNLIAKEKGENYFKIYTVLSFPLGYLLDRIPYIFSEFVFGAGYLAFILNSALWSLVFYFIVRRFFRRN